MVAMAGDRWRLWSARVAVVVAGVVVFVALSRLWSYATQDDPDMVERADIAALATVACAQMRDSVAAAAVSTSAPLKQRVGAINAQNDAVIELVSRMQSIGDEELAADQPAVAWLQDWRRLIAARDAYARSLAAGKPKPMELPVVDGRGLVERLNGVGLNCRVPLALLAP
jgi:hypothetical protein